MAIVLAYKVISSTCTLYSLFLQF